MKFSVILPTYNRKTLLSHCLESLLNQDYPKRAYEIIVVDDGSEDDTSKFMNDLKKKHKNLRYYRIRHKGQGVARNVGLRKVKGEFIAFTDDDCIVEKQWLKKIEDEFKKTGVDAVGGSILNPTNRYIAWATHILYFSSRSPKSKGGLTHNIPPVNVAYRFEAIKNLLFQEHLGTAGYEDSLFNFNLCKQARKILFCPNIIVEHHSWDEKYGLRKFFYIQRRTAKGFVLGGYIVHGKIGKILMKLKILNLFFPHFLLYAFIKCLKNGYFLRFIYHFPLLLVGEFYKDFKIFSFRHLPEYNKT